MARFLGPNSVLKSPRTTRSYRVRAADRWAGAEGLRPPAYIIGVGGFGVTYRVVDDQGRAFAMKEYFPRDHAKRGADGRITPNASEGGFSRKIYEEGLRRFVAESHMLISFNHDSICRVVDTFDDNGTSYQVMRLIEGRETLEAGEGPAKIQRRVTLDDYLKEVDATEGVEVDLALIEPVLRQLLDALHYIHTDGTQKAQAITGEVTRAVLHRDIKPGNVLIEAPAGAEEASAAEILTMPGVRALLIDFGSARIFREAEEDDVSRSIGVVTEGYAPPELKDNHPDEQGPHSDIYSLAAVIWRAFLGRKPTSTQLANGAKLANLAKPVTGPDGKERPRAPKAFLDAVDKALSAGTSARPQSVAAWRAQLFAGDKAPPQRRDDKRKATDDDKAKPKPRTSPWVWIGGAGAVAGGIIAIAMAGAGDVEQHILKQGQAAYEDALRLSTQASVIAERAEIDAREGASEVDAALTSAQEASDKYTRYEASQTPLRIHHNYIFEGAGETFGAYRWCHRKSDTIVPDEPYRCDRQGCMSNGPQTDWACTPHTHLISQSFDEVRNPWRVTGTGYIYDGQVDPFEAILGSGALKLGDDAVVAGRFRPRGGSSFEVSGASAIQKVRQRGLFRVELGKPLADLWSGEELDGRRVAFRGRAVGGGRLGVFIAADGERFFGGQQAGSGLRTGRASLADGSSLYVSGAADGQSTRAWGEIQAGARRYFGQIAGGKPDGCGVWEDAGNREAGYFVDGARTSGAPSTCKKERYASPDLTGFDGGGEAAATPATNDSYPEKK